MSRGRGSTRYRASSRFELVPIERLDRAERERVVDAADFDDLYGILRPRASESTPSVKAVDRDTALLFLTLREPGPLPPWAEREAGEERIRELVLQRVLEIDDGGSFVSGPDAVPLLRGDAFGDSHDDGALSALSEAALEHAAALPVDDRSAVTRRLYSFNRLPVTPVWERRTGGTEEIRRLLGIEGETLNGWRSVSREETEGWLAWRRPAGASPSTTTVKLYLNLTPEDTATAFSRIPALLRRGGASAFKVGATTGNLLRPDKLVAYLPDRNTLRRSGSLLEEELAGLASHGVPFTAPIGKGTLLSWGTDPPSDNRGGSGASWRSWICERLAGFLAEARDSDPTARVAFAKERIRGAGVDPDTWRPVSDVWDST